MNRKEFIHSTLAMLAEMGYKYLEFGGTYGENPTQLKQFMNGIGLVPLAGGTSIAEMQGNEKACAQSSINYLESLKF